MPLASGMERHSWRIPPAKSHAGRRRDHFSPSPFAFALARAVRYWPRLLATLPRWPIETDVFAGTSARRSSSLLAIVPAVANRPLQPVPAPTLLPGRHDVARLDEFFERRAGRSARGSPVPLSA